MGRRKKDVAAGAAGAVGAAGVAGDAATESTAAGVAGPEGSGSGVGGTEGSAMGNGVAGAGGSGSGSDGVPAGGHAEKGDVGDYGSGEPGPGEEVYGGGGEGSGYHGGVWSGSITKAGGAEPDAGGVPGSERAGSGSGTGATGTGGAESSKVAVTSLSAHGPLHPNAKAPHPGHKYNPDGDRSTRAEGAGTHAHPAGAGSKADRGYGSGKKEEEEPEDVFASSETGSGDGTGSTTGGKGKGKERDKVKDGSDGLRIGESLGEDRMGGAGAERSGSSSKDHIPSGNPVSYPSSNLAPKTPSTKAPSEPAPLAAFIAAEDTKKVAVSGARALMGMGVDMDEEADEDGDDDDGEGLERSATPTPGRSGSTRGMSASLVTTKKTGAPGSSLAGSPARSSPDHGKEEDEEEEGSGSGTGGRFTAAEKGKGKAPLHDDDNRGLSLPGGYPTGVTPASPMKRRVSPSAVVSPSKKVAFNSSKKNLERGMKSPEVGDSDDEPPTFHMPMATPSRASKRRREASHTADDEISASDAPSDMSSPKHGTTKKRSHEVPGTVSKHALGQTPSESSSSSSGAATGSSAVAGEAAVGVVVSPGPIQHLPIGPSSIVSTPAIGATVNTNNADAGTVAIPADFLRSFVFRVPTGTVIDLPMASGPPLRWIAPGGTSRPVEVWTPPNQLVAVEVASDFVYTGDDPDKFEPGMRVVLKWLTDHKEIDWVHPIALEYATGHVRSRTSETLAWTKTCDALRGACRPFRAALIAESFAGKVICCSRSHSAHHLWNGLARGIERGDTLTGIQHIDIQQGAIDNAPFLLQVLRSATSATSLTMAGDGRHWTIGYTERPAAAMFEAHEVPVLPAIEQAFLHADQITRAKQRLSKIMPKLKWLVCKIDVEHISVDRLRVDASDLVHIVHFETRWGGDIFSEPYGPPAERGFDEPEYEHQCQRLVIQCIDAHPYRIIKGEMQHVHLNKWLQSIASSFHLKGKWPKLQIFHIFSRLAVHFGVDNRRWGNPSPPSQVLNHDKGAWCPTEVVLRQKAVDMGNLCPQLHTVMFTFGLTVPYQTSCHGVYLSEVPESHHSARVRDRVVHHMVAKLSRDSKRKVVDVDIEIFTSEAWEKVESMSRAMENMIADHIDVDVHGPRATYVGGTREAAYGAVYRN